MNILISCNIILSSMGLENLDQNGGEKFHSKILSSPSKEEGLRMVY